MKTDTMYDNTEYGDQAQAFSEIGFLQWSGFLLSEAGANMKFLFAEITYQSRYYYLCMYDGSQYSEL